VPAPGLLPGAHRDLRFQPEVGSDRGHFAVDRGQVRCGPGGQQDTEHELAADDDLLHVVDRQLVRGQRREQA
jgi:hypothetical protein